MDLNFKTSKLNWVFAIVGLVALFAFILNDKDSTFLNFSFLVGLFFSFFLFVQGSIKQMFWIGFFIRLMLLFTPSGFDNHLFYVLTQAQDIAAGISPYRITSDVLFANLPFYPPLIYWLVWISAKFSEPFYSICFLKIIVLAGELGVFVMLKKLTERFSLPENKIATYWLNPVVLIFIGAGTHFEGITLFFLLMAIYAFVRLKENNGIFHFTFSVLSSFSSVILLPLILLKVSWKRALKIAVGVLILIALCFAPFFSSANFKSLERFFELTFFQHYFSWIYFALFLIAMLLISYWYRFRNRLVQFKGYLILYCCYLLFLPSVPIWFMIIPLGFSVFTKFYFPLIWSVLLMLFQYSFLGEFIPKIVQLMLLLIPMFFELQKNTTFKSLLAGFKTN